MNKTILCIEDNPIFANLLRMNLEKHGYDAHVAVDGETGLSSAIELLPDLILLDVMLPGIDGYQVCSKLKSDANLKKIPVIMLTGKDGMESVWMGMDIGADDYILKSKPIPEIIAFIDDWIVEK